MKKKPTSKLAFFSLRVLPGLFAAGALSIDTAVAASCADATQNISIIEGQISKLENGTSPPHSSPAYHKALLALQQQLTAANYEKHFDCGDPGYGRGSATVIPKYAVLAVIYSPPGSNGGKGASSVDYATGTTFDTNLTTTNSFKNTVSISATVGASAGIASVSATVGFSDAESDQDKSALDFKTTTKTDLKVPGPAVDGVNHDEDRIYLWLSPSLDVNLTQTPTGTTGSWQLSQVNNHVDDIYVYVGWLKHPETMSPGVQQNLAANGITPADYPGILAYDPLASDPTAITDVGRYVPLSTSFPYEPPYAASDASSTETYTVTNEQTDKDTVTNTSAKTFSAAVTAKVTAGFVSASLTVKDQMTWTAQQSREVSNGDSTSASVSIGEPAFGYTGPVAIAVYQDRLYNTFAFAPSSTTISFSEASSGIRTASQSQANPSA
jgi:hypothetical protein